MTISGGVSNYNPTAVKETYRPHIQEVYTHERTNVCALALYVSIVNQILSLSPSKGGVCGGGALISLTCVCPLAGNIQLPRPGVLSLATSYFSSNIISSNVRTNYSCTSLFEVRTDNT